MPKRKFFPLHVKIAHLQCLFLVCVGLIMAMFLIKLLYKTHSNDFQKWNWSRRKIIMSTSNETHNLYIRQNGEYWIIYNYVTAEEHYHGNETITLTTHCDYKNLRHLSALVNRWRAPISVAVLASGNDFSATIDTIRYLYDCDRYNQLIRRYVTFSLCMHNDFKPNDQILYEDEFLAIKRYTCVMPFYIQELTFRELHELPYPLNLMRNIGRITASTYYVLPLDIHVLPPPNFVKKFLIFSQTIAANFPERSVFYLVTIELPHNVISNVPTTKEAVKPYIKNMTEIESKGNIENEEELKALIMSDLLKVWGSYRPSADPSTYDIVHYAGLDEDYLGNIDLYGVTINEWEPLYDERYRLTDSGSLASQTDLLRTLRYHFYLMDKAFLLKRNGTVAVSTMQFEEVLLKYESVVTKNHLLYSARELMPHK